MHQQQQSPAARKDDGGGPGQLQQHHRGLPGWHKAALQLISDAAGLIPARLRERRGPLAAPQLVPLQPARLRP